MKKIVILALLSFSPALAQTASLSGHVLDESGAVVPAAKVTASGHGPVSAVTSGADGAYSFTGLVAGSYSITASAPNLTMPPINLRLKPGAQTLDVKLSIAVTTTQVNVQENANVVSTDAASNASAMVISGDALQSLSDDPEDLQADLEALAGPSAGPSGNAIFIDGFSGGQLPAKESIREIRINQNPFSPEYDKLGLGRIEIFTKPGTNKFHGTVAYNLGSDLWNSRNPYAAQKAPFLLQESENSFSGPLTKRSSFTLDLERQAVDNGSVSNAIVLAPGTLIATPFSSVITTPQRHTRVGPHVDYQIDDNNYLSLRYTMTRAAINDAGIGSSDLISRGYHLLNTFNTAQLIETSIHGTALNETRFQYFRWGNSTAANTQAPEIQVLGDFNGGGASKIYSHDVQTSYELQNNTSIVHGVHSWRFGIRLRGQKEDSYLPQNFNGTFTFSGALAPQLNPDNQVIPGPLVQISSIEQYRRTLLGLPGGEASQFTITGGIPGLSVNQFDLGAFAGDEWRVRPNLTLNLGIRYETQTNIHDRLGFAPRMGVAWAPGGRGSHVSKTVLRAGFGIFYDRFPLADTLMAQRYNGIVQQQYVITDPSFYPNIPPLTSLAAGGQLNPSTQSIQEVDSHLRAPYLLQSAVTLERQLPKNTTVAITYANAHALHLLRSDDINSPLPGSYSGPGTGVYPYPAKGPIFLMESAGLYNQNQLIVNLNSKLNSAVSLFGSYVLNKARSNTDGVGTFPGNPYNFAGDYGPASTDIRHRFVFGGSVNTRWNIRLNPLITWQSGAPFDITTGADPYGTTLFFARPGISADPNKPGLIQTLYGLLDSNPVPGETIIGRNAGRGPYLMSVNLRVTKTWGFGSEHGASGAVSSHDSAGGNGGGFGPQAPPRGLFSNSPTSRRYNLSVAISGRDLLNHTNPGAIIGDITSPLFGKSNQVAGSPNGEGFSENASNRRLELQVRFTF